VYNEADNLRSGFSRFITWLNEFVKTAPGLNEEVELIFAEDGSTDGSYKILQGLHGAFDCPVKIVHSLKRLGKGGGFRNGFMASRGQVVIMYDCDMAVSPDQSPRLLENINEGNDIVIGSRKHKDTRLINYPTAIRFLYGQFAYVITKSLFYLPIKETQCGFKAFKKDKVMPLIKTLYTTGWLFDLEIMLRGYYGGLSIVEIPVKYQHIKTSRIHPIYDPIKIFLDILRMRLCTLKYYPIFPFKPGSHQK
jgi:glycosyltransferase involved in cell wall biosynthesis